MPKRVIERGSWVHIFDKGTFGGRGRLLAPGQREKVARIGSIIVGPRAIVEIFDSSGLEITRLSPRQLVGDFSKFILKKPASHIRVAKAESPRQT